MLNIQTQRGDRSQESGDRSQWKTRGQEENRGRREDRYARKKDDKTGQRAANRGQPKTHSAKGIAQSSRAKKNRGSGESGMW